MHGHHTASALLAQQAFDMTNDASAFSEQLQFVEPWQPKGLYWNTYNFGGNFRSEHADESGYFTVPLGTYNPVLGKSYDEISALSRSEHKSQGFGSTGRRGNLDEYLMFWKGEMPKEDIFESINTTWSRVANGKAIGDLISKINASFDIMNPAASVKDLMMAREMISELDDEYWKQVKLKEIDIIIKSSLGLYLEVVTNRPNATQGDQVQLSIEAINRTNAAVELKSVEILGADLKDTKVENLLNNQKVSKSLTLSIDRPISQPYWLENEATLGMYKVEDQNLRGLLQNPAPYVAKFDLNIEGKPYTYETALVYKKNDRVVGEFYRPFVVTPPVLVNTNESILIFPNEEPKEINITVIAGKDDISGELTLDVPEGWKIYPKSHAFSIAKNGGEYRTQFKVLPTKQDSEGYAQAKVKYNGRTFNQGLKLIEYAHIPVQTIFPTSQAKVVRRAKEKGQHVGYIMGSGDAIPESLEQIGYSVDMIEPKNVTAESLEVYDAIIIGIRAFNTIDRMRVIQPELMKYVNKGGTVIAQYNTSMKNQPKIGPYPFTISRERVTKEEAEVTILEPNHPIIDGPNKITSKDFEGWVQERGLYFPNQWDDRYIPILAANDPGEPSRKGGLLVAEYGKGYFIYTGYSWFRELPAGVAGAFRIFANMISLGNEQPNEMPIKMEVITND